MSTKSITAKTTTRDVDIAVPRNLERLVSATLGADEANLYCDCVCNGTVYSLDEEKFESLRQGIFAAVISDSRVESSIYNVSRTSNYILGPYSALAYGSLLDYRAKTGESRPALLFSERSPVCDVEQVAAYMRVEVPIVFRRMSSQ
jgi:threonine synthase